jgi:hypothetical protein
MIAANNILKTVNVILRPSSYGFSTRFLPMACPVSLFSHVYILPLPAYFSYGAI